MIVSIVPGERRDRALRMLRRARIRRAIVVGCVSVQSSSIYRKHHEGRDRATLPVGRGLRGEAIALRCRTAGGVVPAHARCSGKRGEHACRLCEVRTVRHPLRVHLWVPSVPVCRPHRLPAMRPESFSHRRFAIGERGGFGNFSAPVPRQEFPPGGPAAYAIS